MLYTFLSTYVWQMPSAWPRTAMSVLFMTYCTNSFDPRGIMRSMYSYTYIYIFICMTYCTNSFYPRGIMRSMHLYIFIYIHIYVYMR